MAATQTLSPEDTDAADALIRDARGLYWQGRYDDALAAMDEIVARYPGYLRAHCARVITLMQLGRAEEGRAAAAAALARDETYGLTYSVLAMCQARLGDRASAAANFERSLALWPADGRVYYNYACYWAQLGKDDECCRVLGAALELQPDLVDLVGRDADFARFAAEGWFRDLLAQHKKKILRAKTYERGA